MEVDTATSVSQASGKHLLPELEIYCYLLLLLFLIDQKKYNEVCGLFPFIYFSFLFIIVDGTH